MEFEVIVTEPGGYQWTHNTCPPWLLHVFENDSPQVKQVTAALVGGGQFLVTRKR